LPNKTFRLAKECHKRRSISRSFKETVEIVLRPKDRKRLSSRPLAGATIMLSRISRKTPSLRRLLATHASAIEKDCISITPPYVSLIHKLEQVRNVLNRPLTLAEKILYSHIIEPEALTVNSGKIRGEAYLQLRPERVAMQDASAQYVLVLFSQ